MPHNASTTLRVFAMSMFGIHGDCHFACNRSSVAVDKRCVYTDMYIFDNTQHIYNDWMFVYISALFCLQVTCVVVCCMFMVAAVRVYNYSHNQIINDYHIFVSRRLRTALAIASPTNLPLSYACPIFVVCCSARSTIDWSP